MSRTLVVGVGSPQGDDQAGWLVADRLTAHHTDAGSPPGWTVRRARIPLDLLDWLDGVDRLVICDACEALGEPGQLHCWTWPDPAIAACRSLTSHDFGLPSVLQMAGALGRLPRQVTIWGIEMTGSEMNGREQPHEPALELHAAVARAVAEILAALK